MERVPTCDALNGEKKKKKEKERGWEEAEMCNPYSSPVPDTELTSEKKGE